ISASLLGTDPAAAERLTVADVIRGLALDEAKFSYSDEPPGKLREVECPATLGDAKVKVRVRIEVVYTLGLFSDKRQWDIKAVRAAAVRRVSIQPQAAEK